MIRLWLRKEAGGVLRQWPEARRGLELAVPGQLGAPSVWGSEWDGGEQRPSPRAIKPENGYGARLCCDPGLLPCANVLSHLLWVSEFHRLYNQE